MSKIIKVDINDGEAVNAAVPSLHNVAELMLLGTALAEVAHKVGELAFKALNDGYDIEMLLDPNTAEVLESAVEATGITVVMLSVIGRKLQAAQTTQAKADSAVDELLSKINTEGL